MKCINSITVTPSSITVKQGSWYYGLNATVCPTDAECKSVKWTSSNPSVASVNESNGYVYGISAGTAVITATATDGCGASDSCTVTVMDRISVDSVTLEVSSVTLEKNDCTTLNATVCPSNATNKALIWTSSNESVATVDNGAVCAKENGTAVIKACTTDGSNLCDYCTVTVTGDVLVSNVVIRPNMGYMDVGDTKVLSADILPNNATNKEVVWRSDDPNIITVIPSSGLIRAVATGNTTVYATACDGSGAVGSCNITVNPFINVEAVTVCPQNKTIGVGDSVSLCATVCPENATNKNIIWTSSDEDIASVDASSGTVTGISGGDVYIYATSEDGSKTGRCEITVDSREKVIIKKDSHSFYVEFADGKIWKYIGLDLSKREDYYDMLDRPIFDREFYDDLIVEEQRYLDNICVGENGVIVNKSYSEKQIGFLYLLDPLGIEYYMRYNACDDMSLGEKLFFKDMVYKEIFGVWPRLIKVFPDKTIEYYVYSTSISADTRADYYTDAEILFGEHPIYDILSLISFLLDVVPSVLQSLFSMFYPPVGVVLNGIELVKFLFFSASASGVLSSGTSSIMEEYTTNIYTLSSGESAGVKAGKAMGWVNFVLGTFSTILDAAEVFTPSINDITIYNKINESDYRANYNVDGSELSMADIISRIS